MLKMLGGVSPIAPLKDSMGRKACAISAIVVAVVLTWILTWDFWFVRQPLVETVDQENEKSKSPFVVSSQNIIFEIGAGSFITLTPRKPVEETTQIKVVLDDTSIIETIASFTAQEGTTRSIFIPIHSKHVAGHCLISFKTSSKSEEWANLFKMRIKVKVVHEIAFGYLSIVIGYVYFFFWSACYYPQIYRNWVRRSVVGFSFDYLALNMTGHLCYGVFNACMFYNSDIQKAYTKLHPKGELPVKFNDVLFSLHAVLMNVVLIVQCVMFDRGDQRVSVPMITLVGGLWLSIGSGLFAAITEKLAWLQYLYYLSYIKVGTTPIKYTPQVYLHYLKKSTEGWSVYSVLLDFSGGIMSFTQMAIDAINNDDWDGTLGNPGKLGLSFIAIIYDSIFLSQHFLLYPKTRKRKETGEGLIVIEDSEHRNDFHRKLDALKQAIFPATPSLESKKLRKVYNL